jgi:hypothetical protein
MLVDAQPVRLRTRVQFPPPPLAEVATQLQTGLFRVHVIDTGRRLRTTASLLKACQPTHELLYESRRWPA